MSHKQIYHTEIKVCKCESTTQVENLEVKTSSLSLSLSVSFLPSHSGRTLSYRFHLQYITSRRFLLAHSSREQSVLIDTSLGLAYLLTALSTSADSLLSPSSPSENQSPIKLSYGMPPVLKSQVRQIDSERNHMIHITALAPE